MRVTTKSGSQTVSLTRLYQASTTTSPTACHEELTSSRPDQEVSPPSVSVKDT